MSSYRSRRRRIQTEVNGLLLTINEKPVSADTLIRSSSDYSNIKNVNTPKVNTQLKSSDFLGLNSELELDDSSFSFPEVTFNRVDNDNSDKELQQKLAVWAVRYNIPHNALTDLLKILHPQVAEKIPLCSKTLLQTPRKLNVSHIPGGKYFYFGLKAYLQKLIQNNQIDI